MRTIPRFFSLLMLGMIPLLYSGCKKDDPVKPITDQQIEKLNGSWKATEVKADDILQDEYDDFVLTFSGDAGNKFLEYTPEGRPFVSPWPESGTLLFDDADPQRVLHRDDDVVITYEVTNTTLTISFDFSEEGYINNGRTSGITGEWEFKFSKQ
ncbi:MAG: hypothetical protein KIT62_01785 [Cyclobacteriaceae bacterium]|nr:hypothetical protein [Cyclobacteriaceae bacterium]